jgi:hypothetical protein
VLKNQIFNNIHNNLIPCDTVAVIINDEQDLMKSAGSGIQLPLL